MPTPDDILKAAAARREQERLAQAAAAARCRRRHHLEHLLLLAWDPTPPIDVLAPLEERRSARDIQHAWHAVEEGNVALAAKVAEPWSGRILAFAGELLTERPAKELLQLLAGVEPEGDGRQLAHLTFQAALERDQAAVVKVLAGVLEAQDAQLYRGLIQGLNRAGQVLLDAVNPLLWLPEPEADCAPSATPAASPAQPANETPPPPAALPEDYVLSISGPVQRPLLLALNGKGTVKIVDILRTVYGEISERKLESLLKAKDRVSRKLTRDGLRLEIHQRGETLTLVRV